MFFTFTLTVVFTLVLRFVFTLLGRAEVPSTVLVRVHRLKWPRLLMTFTDACPLSTCLILLGRSTPLMQNLGSARLHRVMAGRTVPIITLFRVWAPVVTLSIGTFDVVTRCENVLMTMPCSRKATLLVANLLLALMTLVTKWVGLAMCTVQALKVCSWIVLNLGLCVTTGPCAFYPRLLKWAASMKQTLDPNGEWKLRL